MRIFELLLAITIALSIFSLYFNPKHRNRWFHLFPSLSLTIVILQIFIEGYRWQMYPAYILAILFFLFTIRNLRYFYKSLADLKKKDRKWLRLIGASTSILLLIISILPHLFFPIFKLPVPSGQYSVGIMYDYFIDKSRKEYSTPDTTDFCEISAQIWYPAEVTGDIGPIKYWENASEKSAIITTFWDELPSFLFNYFSLIKTHSYLNANIAKTKQKYPVLIFNHGSVGVPSVHTAVMEDLASHGYIIFSIGHADYTPFFVMPNRKIRAFDPDNKEYQSKMRENDDDETRKIANDLMSSNDLKEQESLLRQFLERNPQNQRSIRRWVDDISFTVDELEKINNGGSMFGGKLDLNRLGVFGNSFGGAASIQVCIRDKRFKAAVNVDCIQFGDFLDKDPTQPMMFISSD